MTTLNAKVSERVALLAAINPASQAAGVVTTGWFPLASFDAIVAVVQAGALGAAATLDAKLQQAQDSTGTNAKDIAGKAITQLTQAGSGSNKQAMISARVADLDVANDFAFVRLSLTIATAASLVNAVVLGIGNRRGKASSFNANTLAQSI